MITPKERPILFSAPMVVAIREDRKTQTRRVFNRVNGIGLITELERSDTAGYDWAMRDKRMLWNEFTNAELLERCPHGLIGDHLYVKEAAWMWCERKPNGTTKTGKNKWLYDPLRGSPVIYCADHPDKPTLKIAHEETGNEWGWRKKIGRFLPRWASRTTLEIVSVRVERLQDISECDAKAEGSYVCDYFGRRLLDQSSNQGCYKWGYRSIWESLNGSGSWDLNPWVWVVEFKTLEIARAAA